VRTDGTRVAAMFCALARLGRNKRVHLSNFSDENVRRVAADGLPLCCSDVLTVEKGGA
jgi:hypothetical protein